jgi:DNA-binding XRE family transcriptional regulator
VDLVVRFELLKARKLAGLTQQELADKANIKRFTYQRIEAGVLTPNIDIVYSIALALGKKIDEIFLPNDVCLDHKADSPPASASRTGTE